MTKWYKKVGKAIEKGWKQTSGLGLDVTGLGSIVGGPLGANIFDPLDITGSNARRYQDYEAQQEMNFNATEAEKTRNFEQYMSNTAHQREMADLKAAGLNPVLTTSGGVGASTPSGATATGAMGGSAEGNAAALGTILNAFSAIKNASSAAKATKSQADLNSMQEKNIANEIQNRDLNTAQNIAESTARIGHLNEQARSEAIDNHINEMLGLSKQDTGQTRQAAWIYHNSKERKEINKAAKNAVDKDFINKINAESKRAENEFNRKVLSKLSKQESIRFAHGNKQERYKLAKIAKQRGAFN